MVFEAYRVHIIINNWLDGESKDEIRFKISIFYSQ